MAMYRVQFHTGMSVTQLMALYGTQEQCEAALEKCRWPAGFVCPMCTCKEHYVVWDGKAKTFQCQLCRHQTTLTSGTIFHSSKWPLTKWFQAVYFLTQAKNNVSDLEPMRLVGVCYRTAWRLKHKILDVMSERESERRLEGLSLFDAGHVDTAVYDWGWSYKFHWGRHVAGALFALHCWSLKNGQAQHQY